MACVQDTAPVRRPNWKVSRMGERYQLLPDLSADEYERLKADIALRGVMVPIEVDESGNILDGHNRARIATELGVDCPRVIRVGLPEHEKRLHAVTLNLARRQLTDAQRVLIGRQIEPDLAERARLRQVVAGVEFGRGKSAGKVPDNCPEPIGRETRDEVAAEVGLGSGRTYERHKDVIEQAEELAASDPVVANLLDAIDIGEADMVDLRKAIKPHVARNTGDNEWYTPAGFIEAARQVMGGIDLDPASSEIAQRTVQALRFYTKDDDGLAHPWAGSVWLNPPYAQPLIGKFVAHLLEAWDARQVSKAIVLVNNGTETQWGQQLLAVAAAVCFPSSRIRFLHPDGKLGAPLQGQMIVYLAREKSSKFADIFTQFGVVLDNG